MHPSILKYLRTRGAVSPWKIAGAEKNGFQGAVVIPALAESRHLAPTLYSLAQNPAQLLSRFLILVVVNHREDAPLPEKMDNRLTLQRLLAGDGYLNRLQLGWVDAASPGLELPVKRGGVGLARKIGFDLALTRLEEGPPSPLLVSLDADTLVRRDYLPALVKHFQEAKGRGAVIPFCHQPGATPEEDRAIHKYELFLRSYVLGLSKAGSPYAFHTVGSAMACTAEIYARAGGMNTRTAGEDFYFLQHLAKTAGVTQVQGTVIYPSARPSHRVPFGTGRSISRLLAKEKEAVLFYQQACFEILRDWLALVNHNAHTPGEKLRGMAERISAHLGAYLDTVHFPAVWDKLCKNFPDPSKRIPAFHGWFDGLRTMKLIHHLSALTLPRKEPEEVLPDLLKWAGLERTYGIEEQLSLLREIQIGRGYDSDWSSGFEEGFAASLTTSS